MSAESHTPLRLQEQDLEGKIAIVTGATKGIGRAITIELATRGASILGSYSSAPSSQLFTELASNILALYSSAATQSAPKSLTPPTLVGIQASITDTSVPKAILNALQVHFTGKVDIVVFNAAVMSLAKMGEGTSTEDFVDICLAGNVIFPVMLMEALVAGKFLRPGGRVVAISSEAVRDRRPSGGSLYAASKAALECLMRTWADELGTASGMEGTTFNSVSVGFTRTEAFNNIPATAREELVAADSAQVAVANRIGEVDDIAGVVGLLVSEKARWMSGSVVDASGGKAKIM